MDDITLFRGDYEFLRNPYPHPITALGVSGQSIEYVFQALKATNEKDRNFILDAPYWGEAKKRGKHIKCREDWEEIKIFVMWQCLREKFKDPELRGKLLATGDAKLVEGNAWKDFYWGVCDGKGENWLGRLLMEVRHEVKR